jgi:hypothetical protein
LRITNSARRTPPSLPSRTPPIVCTTSLAVQCPTTPSIPSLSSPAAAGCAPARALLTSVRPRLPPRPRPLPHRPLLPATTYLTIPSSSRRSPISLHFPALCPSTPSAPLLRPRATGTSTPRAARFPLPCQEANPTRKNLCTFWCVKGQQCSGQGRAHTLTRHTIAAHLSAPPQPRSRWGERIPSLGAADRDHHVQVAGSADGCRRWRRS